MYQAVTPRATVGPIGPRPAPAEAPRTEAPRTEAPQRRAAVVTIVIGALASLATLVLVGLLLTHVLAHGTVGHWDEASTRWLATHRDSGLDAVTKVLSRSADTMGIIAAAVVVAIVVALRRRWDQLAILVTGLVLELSVFISVNAIVGRPRPSVERLGATPTTGSFPSGHTAATLVLYATIALIVSETVRALVWRALAWLAAVLMPIAVGFARVYRGFHHPTDVFFGVLLGCAALIIAIVAVHRWAPTRVQEEVR
jgi:membrane-associated phospholipid phosphatase